MTDKEKIKKEIERLKHNTPNAYDLSRFMLLEEIESFIDSLPEEPKKQPKFKVGDTIKGPCNNIFQVKEVLDKQYVLHSENGDELNSIEIVDKYSCISEKPASEDLENEIERCWKEMFPNGWSDYTLLTLTYEEHKAFAHHFAEWQKQKDLEDLFKSDMTMPNKFYEKGKADAMKEMKEALQTEYEKGRFDMREEMMKDAVDATIFSELKSSDGSVFRVKSDRFRMNGVKIGDIIKVIPIKTEQQ